MADFTLNAPGTTNNPWLPANIIFPVGGIQSDSNGFRPISAYSVIAHNANYGLVITSTVTVGTFDALGDQFYVGAVVRTGANAGGFVGCRFGLSANAVLLTANAAGTNTNISAGATVPATTIGDILACTVSISGGTATITATYNGASITFTGGNTTTTYATEPSLAAGFVMDPEDINGTYGTQFTGTGVLASPTATIAWVV